jgi:hypothetical protein
MYTFVPTIRIRITCSTFAASAIAGRRRSVRKFWVGRFGNSRPSSRGAHRVGAGAEPELRTEAAPAIRAQEPLSKRTAISGRWRPVSRTAPAMTS